MDVAEAADKETAGDEDDLESISEPSIGEKSPPSRKERDSLPQKRATGHLDDEEEELEEDMLENEWDKEQHEDEEEEEHKPLGLLMCFFYLVNSSMIKVSVWNHGTHFTSFHVMYLICV